MDKIPISLIIFPRLPKIFKESNKCFQKFLLSKACVTSICSSKRTRFVLINKIPKNANKKVKAFIPANIPILIKPIKAPPLRLPKTRTKFAVARLLKT